MFRILQAKDLAGEISAHKLAHIDHESSVLEASKLMRESGTTELLVTGEIDGRFLAFGIVTANDIVTRVIAAELDPGVLTAGDIAWTGMAAAESAGDS
jgi:predicted transcriptional regulator